MESISRIVIFNENKRASLYGIGTYIQEYTNSLRGTNFKIYVINLFAGIKNFKVELLDNISIIDIPNAINESLFNYDEYIKRYYKSINYLLRIYFLNSNFSLVFHFNYFHSIGLIKMIKKSFPNSKIVFSVHYFTWCFDILGNNKKFDKAILSSEYKNMDDVEKLIIASYQKDLEIFNISDKIICLSKYSYSLLLKYYKMKEEKLELIYNGLTDTKKLNSKDIYNTEYSYNILQKKVILFVGRIDDIKGIGYLLKAYVRILNLCSNCILFIVGDGDINRYAEYLDPIKDNVITTGRINKNELNRLYKMASLGVIPSFHEQCSYVAIEMMMHGIPVVASTTTGLNEMYDDGKDGLKIEIIEEADYIGINTDLLAEKICYLLSNPNLYKKISSNTRKRYLKYYTDTIFRDKMVNMYSSL